MLIESYEGKKPVAAASARGARNISLVGDVTIGENVTIWHGAVLRGDNGAIVIGDGSNVQDNAVLHNHVVLGKNVTVGHAAIVHGCTVGDNTLIGMGATILTGAVIGEGCIIGANALVTENKVIPPRSLVVGVPGRIVRTTTDEEVAKNKSSAAFYLKYLHTLQPIEE